MTDPPLPPLKTKWFLQSPSPPPPWWLISPSASPRKPCDPPKFNGITLHPPSWWLIPLFLPWKPCDPPRVLRYPPPVPERWIRTGPLFLYLKHLRLWLYLNPIHPNISMHILHTFIYIFPEVMTRRICQTIKRFLSCWSFPLILWH